jgi:hypothetical protein
MPFDRTSIIATLCKHIGCAPLTARDAAAPSRPFPVASASVRCRWRCFMMTTGKTRPCGRSAQPAMKIDCHRHQSLLEGTSGLMRFHAKHVSASESGDYYQVSFDTGNPGEDGTDPGGPNRPYLIIQRQFEALDDGRCYVETHDHGYVGHFHMRLTNFTRARLAFEIARKRNNYVEVSCSLDAVEFEEVQRIVNIIFGQRTRPPARHRRSSTPPDRGCRRPCPSENRASVEALNASRHSRSSLAGMATVFAGFGPRKSGVENTIATAAFSLSDMERQATKQSCDVTTIGSSLVKVR